MKALVIGGSVGGLMAALLLRKGGWDVTVYERAIGDLAGRGAGLGVSQELLDVMKRAGARFDASAGVAQEAHVWMEKDGSIAYEHRRNLMASAWARVYQPLRAALPASVYRQGMALERIEGHEAIFAGGSRDQADLIVGADGVYSTVRKQFLPDVQPRFANYVAWRGIVEDSSVPAETLAAVRGRIVFCFPPGEMLLAMKVPGGVYFIWYRTVSSLAELFTDAAGRNHGMSIPPPLIRPEFIAEMKAHAVDVLPAAISCLIGKTPQPLLQAISDMESPRMTFGRVALLGDAAFVVRPHVAGGAGKAAMDAQCLADSLSGASIDEGLAKYEKSQHDFGTRIVRHSRYLGADLEGRPTERDPRRIIRDYGAPNILHEVQAWR
ncbi:MAG TPA: FAD-dependent monooxygenase [Burkholderiales bacterium]|nr:FAD-dependent monooxygenase [Burkholderiales bacterium]